MNAEVSPPLNDTKSLFILLPYYLMPEIRNSTAHNYVHTALQSQRRMHLSVGPHSITTALAPKDHPIDHNLCIREWS